MTAVLVNPRERTRFLKFAVVGVVGAVVDFGVANLLIKFASFPLVIAGTISFIAAIISNFLWNRYWTYPDSRSKTLFRQFLQFVLVSISGLFIRVPILSLLEPVMLRILTSFSFQLPFLTLDFLAKNFTLAVAVIIVMFWNFFVNRYWTYNDVI
jgi:putative flippase GtrA